MMRFTSLWARVGEEGDRVTNELQTIPTTLHSLGVPLIPSTNALLGMSARTTLRVAESETATTCNLADTNTLDEPM